MIYLKGGSEEGDPLYEGGERDLWLGGQGEKDLLVWYCPLIYLKGGSEEGDPLYEGGERDLWLGGQGEKDLLVLVHQ